MQIFVLALIGGLLFGASIPPCRLSPFAYLGLASLFIANMRHLRWEQRFLTAIIWGLSSSVLPIAFGIRIAEAQRAVYPTDFEIWLITLVPFLTLALVVGIVVAVVGKMWQSGFWRGSVWVFGVTALGIIAERLTFLLSIPVHLAVTQANLRFLVLPIASFAGIWGISWFVWFVSAAIAEIVLNRRANLVTIVTAIIVLLLSTLQFPFAAQVKGHHLLVAAIQNETEDPLTMLSSVLNSRTRDLPSLIVLPELSLGQETPFLQRQLKQILKEAGVHGSFLVVGMEETDPPYNSAVLMDSEGEEILRYRKVHLFGAERWRYRKGREVKARKGFGIAICFDTVFPDIVRKLARQGAKVIAVPNYDPVAVGFLLHHLHAAFFPIRAAENRVSIVKADSMGLSQLIDCDGKVIAEAPLGKATVLNGRVAVCGFNQSNFQTPYTRFGDWFVVLCAIIAVSLFIAQFSRAKRTGEDVAAKP
ncbi:MAG: nitrilase-related carbon-nitrogen hydrolase [Armatimonadota bacterium]